MAKINIKEQDLSTSSAVLSSENVVYVPGYSIMGPINTPTLCTSFDDFISKFGSSPFVYVEDQSVNDIIVEKSGSYEKSWIYAAQLLRAGLPVLFERVTKSDNSTNTNTAHGKIEFRIRSGPGQISIGDTTYYTNDNKLYRESTYTTEVTEIGFSYTIDDSKVTIDFNDSTVGIAEFQIEEGLVSIYGASYQHTSGDEKLERDGVEQDTVILDVTVGQTYVTVGTGVSLPEYRIEGQSFTTDPLNYFTLVAKNQGSYGNNLNITLQNSSTPEQVFATINLSDGVNFESYLVSFDKTRQDYITSQLGKSQIVNITATLTSDFDVTNNGHRIVSGFESSSAISVILSGGTDNTYSDTLAVLSGTSSPFQNITDKMLYDVAFITSGGYPNLKEDVLLNSDYSLIGKQMLDAAGSRGDAVAVLNFENTVQPSQQLGIVENIFPANSVTDNSESLNSFGAVFSPNVTVYCSTTKSDELMPASFAYLRSFANSVRNNAVWFAVSGVKRGLVSEFKSSSHSISQVRMNEWQDGEQSINPIMEIRPSGYCIFGNRTLHFNANTDNLSLLSFLNVRVLNNYLKKVVRQVCLSLTYENNDNVLWNNFKANISPTLDQMKTGRGIFDYKIVKGTTDKKATIAGIVRIQPIEAVESFDIVFSIENSIVNVE